MAKSDTAQHEDHATPAAPKEEKVHTDTVLQAYYRHVIDTDSRMTHVRSFEEDAKKADFSLNAVKEEEEANVRKR